jgi:hypothetical protein
MCVVPQMYDVQYLSKPEGGNLEVAQYIYTCTCTYLVCVVVHPVGSDADHLMT